MFPNTHRIIARKVYEAVNTKLNFELDYKRFSDGNVAPDRYPKMMFMHHTMDGSIDLVQRHLDWLINVAQIQNSEDMKEFSFRLGIVMHFVADYFCRAHNENRYHNMIIHLLYEKQLVRYFNRHAGNVGPCRQMKIEECVEPSGSIWAHIEEKHDVYSSFKGTMGNDFNYSISVSCDVALSIVLQWLKRNDMKWIKKIA